MSLTAQQLARLMPLADEVESDEPNFESSLHAEQLRMLTDILEWHWREREDYFIGADLTIYYSRRQLTERAFRSPHFYLATQTEKRHRWSWITWEEDGRAPDLIIELLADETAEQVKTIKQEIYARHIRIPEFFYYHPWTEEFAGFELRGRDYEELPADTRGRRWSCVLDLYLGVHQHRLRYFTRAGELVVSPLESLSQAKAAAEATRRADSEKQRADKLAAKLRELGLDPNQL